MIPFNSVLIGWRNNLNWGKHPPELRAIFEKRLDICIACPHFEENKIWKRITKLVDGKNQTERQEKVNGYRCGICTCVSKWKVSVENESCPLTIEEHNQPPKWTEIIKDENGNIINDGIVHKL